MKQDMTMGSLFSGSGGFELASAMVGITPIWASEIEPLPILVTKKNFPDMAHLGDINYLKGSDTEPVTIIAGGSPCQDMSVAGQRAGLDGSRSSLFREQIRIVKEMREHDIKDGRTGKYIRPRFMVWENVPGAFSSNKGKDFQAVLQAIAEVTDPDADVPLAPKGKWSDAGCIMGDHFSIAWRVLDAQYWGVPQRRKRIYLVADFGGNTAPKILFKREGLRRDSEKGREAWQGTAGDTSDSTPAADRKNVRCYDIGDRRTVANENINVSPTLLSKMGTGGNNVPIVLENHPQDSRVTISEDGIVPTLTGKMGTGGGNVPMIMENKPIAVDTRNLRTGEKSETLHGCGHGDSVSTVMQPIAFHLTQDPTSYTDKTPCITQGNPKTGQATIGVAIPVADKATRHNGGGDTRKNDGAGNGLGVGEPGSPANTLTAADRHAVAYAIDREAFNQGANAQYNISIQEEQAQTLVAKGPGAVAHELEEIDWEYIVRKFTPLECCRLQGFPDEWTEGIAVEEPTASTIREWMIIWAEWWRIIGRSEGIQLPKDAKQVERWLKDPVSDSALYKMWGNGIALPCAEFVMEGIAEIIEQENKEDENE